MSDPRSHRARSRPGADRVPADLLQRPPAHRPCPVGLGRPRRRLHRRRFQLGTMAAVLIYFRADLMRIALAWLSELRTPIPTRQPGGAAGLVHPPRHDPDLDLRLHFQGPDRNRRPQPLPDRLGPDPLLLRDAGGRAGRRPAARPGRDERPRRFLRRHGAGAGPDPRRLALGGRRSPPASSATSTAIAAARYSFLLSVPAVVLSGLFELRKVGESGGPSVAATVIATLVAFVSGYLAIAWLLRYLGTHRSRIFVVYRIALGACWSSDLTAHRGDHAEASARPGEFARARRSPVNPLNRRICRSTGPRKSLLNAGHSPAAGAYNPTHSRPSVLR